jgi:hypothetical protein
MNNPLALSDPSGLCNPGANGIWTPNGYVIAGTTNDSDPEPCTTFQPWLTDPNFQCDYYNSCGSGSSSGGGGGGSGSSGAGGSGAGTLLATIKGAYCSAIPSGRVDAMGASIGTVGGATGSLDLVTNYNTGQISGFASGGLFGGINGEWSAQISSGSIYGNLAANNSNFSGSFRTVSGSAGLPGISLAQGSGLTIFSVTASKGLFSPITGAYSKTASKGPFTAWELPRRHHISNANG